MPKKSTGKFQKSSPKILTGIPETPENAGLTVREILEVGDGDEILEGYGDFVESMAIHFDISEKPKGSDEILFRCIELAEEVGELLGKVKRVMRDGEGEVTDEDIEGILYELGDILFFLSLLTRRFGSSLTEVLLLNHHKLTSRRKRGTVQGKGDYR